MFHHLEKSITEAFAALLEARYGVAIAWGTEQPKQAAFGELAVPAAFQLARTLKKPPRAIAQEIVDGLGAVPGVAALEIAGNGYINVRFDRGSYGEAVLRGDGDASRSSGGKLIVEHTNINPNKAAHIGHLRNAVLGDTFVRMLRFTGNQVEVQNYIDNTGVQVADVVVGFRFLEKKSPAQVRELIAGTRFDYVCWDLYAKVSQHYANSEEAKQWRARTLHAIEANEGELAELGHLVADAIVRCHLNTMWRLGIAYDVLPRESEILHMQFWAKAFEQLKERGAIYLETEGKNQGCWVMAATAFKEQSEEGDSKVIVRSNGTVTYVGKDIAYQLWKFGLLGKDFRYRRLQQEPYELWVASGEGEEKAFGRGSRVYNVIDSRQSYLQDVVVAGLRALHYEEQAKNSIHFSYEMVALSPRACADLGIELSEEDKRKAYVEVSGRKGLGVKADDLLDKLIEKAYEEVQSRNGDQPEDRNRAVAEQIAVAALRYFMLKFTRNTVIAFDLQEALSFTGETGPYLQYAAVRASKILAKLADRGGAMPDFAALLPREAFARQLGDEELWQLLLEASKMESAVERAVGSGEPSHVARFAFQLGQAFNTFYQKYPVLDEPDAERRAFLLWMTAYFRSQLERTLRVLGIQAPEYM
ncbi:MAG: arginine--tRNA ligase [Bryobacteraceae bacterium]|nr:arginine--tRNA ligase [Bryobacteraceae bacterium]